MNKIAITGADGFIGSFVIKSLQKRSVKLKLFDFKKHNLLVSESLKSFVKNQDVIIHLAGVNRGTNQELFQVNVLGTLSLLDAISKYSPNTRIIFSSTFQVYLPNSLYGLSKKFAEDLLNQHALNYNTQGTILRFSNVYGPGGKPFYNSVIATFAHLIKSGEVLKINGDGSQKRDFIYVEDVVKAIVKANLHKPKKNVEIIDICSGRENTINEVLKIMREVSGKKFKVLYNRGVKEKPWPTKDKNFKAASQLLDWQPSTSLKEGLRKVMQYERR